MGHPVLFNVHFAGSYLLVTSGICIGNDPCPTEAIYFDGRTKTNYPFPDYPEGRNLGATGGLVGDTYISCGGRVNEQSWSDKCYKFGSTTTIATMRKKRCQAASVVLGNKLWVVGGDDENGINLNSTEFVDPVTGSVEYGPDLPKASYAPCLFHINLTTVMLIGGVPAPLDKTWMYNIEQEQQGWVAGPVLNTGRTNHACGIVKDSVDEGKTIVIVAGGLGSQNYLQSSEYFVLGTDQWKPGPDLEEQISGASGVTTPNGKSFLFVGGTGSFGYQDASYKLECHNLECMWTQVDKKLKVGRQDFLAAFLPDSLQVWD